MTQSKPHLIVSQETTIEDIVRRLNLIPGLHVKVKGKVFQLQEDGTIALADQNIKDFVDVDKELANPLPQRYRRHPKDKKVKAYVNNKPCKRKQKKKK